MKSIQYIGTFDLPLLITQLLEYFPSWRVISGNVTTDYFGYEHDEIGHILILNVPDDTDENELLQVIDAHDPTARIYTALNWQDVLNARLFFMQMPDWSTWTPEQASTYIHDNVLAGMTREEVEAWVDTNVTSLATAKTALKLIGDELVDLREICMRMAYSIMLLRDVAIRRRL